MRFSSTAAYWPASPMRSRTAWGFAVDVDTEHGGPARVGPEVRGEDAHRGRLPGAVRAEQAEHGPARDLEVDAVEGDHLPVVLPEALGLDRDLGHLNHAPECAAAVAVGAGYAAPRCRRAARGLGSVGRAFAGPRPRE